MSRETTVKAGDVIITSGMGGVYPKGLLVGEVSRCDTDPLEPLPGDPRDSVGEPGRP